MAQVYWDNASLAPVDPLVVETIVETYRDEDHGNALLSHQWGQHSRDLLEAAREQVRDFLGADGGDRIIFTSSGSESINLALMGYCRRNKRKGRRILIPDTEHIATLNTGKQLQKLGFEVSRLKVDGEGYLDDDQLNQALSEKPLLITILGGNNEVGTIYPIKELAQRCHEHAVMIHVDACASMVTQRIDVQEAGIDLLTFASNPIYGPPGVAALWTRKGVKLAPVVAGGGQEYGLRSGTENIPGIRGFATATEIMSRRQDDDNVRLAEIQRAFIDRVTDRFEIASLNGPPPGEERLPNIINVSFAGLEGEPLLLNLDMKGVAASTSSACTAQNIKPSHVLTAMGIPEAQMHGAVLFSPGRHSQLEEVDRVLAALEEIIPTMVALHGSPQWKQAVPTSSGPPDVFSEVNEKGIGR